MVSSQATSDSPERHQNGFNDVIGCSRTLLLACVREAETVRDAKLTMRPDYAGESHADGRSALVHSLTRAASSHVSVKTAWSITGWVGSCKMQRAVRGGQTVLSERNCCSITTPKTLSLTRVTPPQLRPSQLIRFNN
jgi:hypothetical protein